MNTHLAKAKEALEAMKQYEPSDLAYGDLLSIGNLQARLAIADALCQIASVMNFQAGRQ